MHESALERLFDEGYTDLGPSHFVVVRFLRRHPEGARISRFAEWAGITQQSAGYLVDYMERGGYISRSPDPTDRRAQIIRVTPKGRAATDIVIGTMARIEDELRARHGSAVVDNVRGVLEEMAVPWETGPALRRPGSGARPHARPAHHSRPT
jgi:DNA-binding MarR family transcriptional regulator